MKEVKVFESNDLSTAPNLSNYIRLNDEKSKYDDMKSMRCKLLITMSSIVSLLIGIGIGMLI